MSPSESEFLSCICLEGVPLLPPVRSRAASPKGLRAWLISLCLIRKMEALARACLCSTRQNTNSGRTQPSCVLCESITVRGRQRRSQLQEQKWHKSRGHTCQHDGVCVCFRAVTESINQLITLCTQQAAGQKECDNALRELEVALLTYTAAHAESSQSLWLILCEFCLPRWLFKPHSLYTEGYKLVRWTQINWLSVDRLWGGCWRIAMNPSTSSPTSTASRASWRTQR